MRTPRPWFRLMWLALAGLGSAPYTQAHAQTPTDTMLSDRLLTRLGTAIAGYPASLVVWVVTCVPDEQIVLRVVMTQREAVAIARDSSAAGRRCIVRGPFVGTGDSLPPRTTMLFLASGVIHMPDSKYDSLGAMSSEVLRVEDIQSITITVQRRIGPEITRVYRPDQVDAVFFTLPAMDKFLFPYYQWVYGVEYTARLRTAIRAHLLAGRIQ